MAAIHLTTAILCLTITSLRSFVDTAPLNPSKETIETIPQIQDSNVRELENLKNSIGNTLKLMKTHSSMYTNIDEEKEGHSDFREEMKSNGKLVAKVDQHVDVKSGRLDENPEGKIRTDVEIPSEGVHKTMTQNIAPKGTTVVNGKNKKLESVDYLNNNLDKYNSYSGIQYSPLDMAEYVFWTGDEKGVTLGIEEFLQEGLMSREEAIAFLQEIKYNLDYLQKHYNQLGLNLQDRYKDRESNFIKPSSSSKTESFPERPELSTSFDLSQLRHETAKKSSINSMSEIGKESERVEKLQQRNQNEEEYDELLERLRLADFLYTEYSLEEVIYQLAKVMFTQSLTRGNAEAQNALQKFTGFLESEAEQGHISRALEKKVLDVLIASLTDTLTENPELIATARDSLSSKQTYIDKEHILRKILALGGEDKIDSYKGKSDRTNKISSQLKDDDLKHTPIGLAKYNTS